jgi:catechol 2,3-dioxygenase-like lactoylglutathione lyase family enzyme
MTFRYTILYVDDVPATLTRFEQAFGLKRGMLHPSEDYGELATGQTRLAFSSRALMQQLGKTPGRADAAHPLFEVAFEVPAAEVESAYARALSAGFEASQPPRAEPWGQTTSYVVDPGEQILIEICSPVGQP